ncbi:MAG: creatininase family protein, partial [Enhydrobacter sp.]
MTARGVWLEDLTWVEAKARFEAGTAVVIPIGAAAKAHGPHLPLKTDALTARALGQGVIDRIDVVAAPVVGFGYYPAFTSFPGSQHLTAETFKALLRELVGNFRAHGVGRIALINTGVSTEKPIDELAREERDLLVLHMRLLGKSAESLIENHDGGHADERETSVMLALDPRGVRMD